MTNNDTRTVLEIATATLTELHDEWEIGDGAKRKILAALAAMRAAPVSSLADDPGAIQAIRDALPSVPWDSAQHMMIAHAIDAYQRGKAGLR